MKTCIKYILMLKSTRDLIFLPSILPLNSPVYKAFGVWRCTPSFCALQKHPCFTVLLQLVWSQPGAGCSWCRHLHFVLWMSLKAACVLGWQKLCWGCSHKLQKQWQPLCLTPVIWAAVDNRLCFEGAFEASRGQSGDYFRPLQFSTWHLVGKDPFIKTDRWHIFAVFTIQSVLIKVLEIRTLMWDKYSFPSICTRKECAIHFPFVYPMSVARISS